jgi:hypothetical protein
MDTDLLDVISRRKAGNQLDIAAVAATGIQVEDPRALATGLIHQFL